MQTDHISVTKDNVILQDEIEYYKRTTEDQFGYIMEANKVISIQGGDLRKSDELIKKQHLLIEKLIERLRGLDEWPPTDTPPFDPDRITRSSGWISYANY